MGELVIQLTYAPDVSAMPMMVCGIWCQVVYAFIWFGHCGLNSVVVLVVMRKSTVMPACASARTAAQLTAARSTVVRAMEARIFAL